MILNSILYFEFRFFADNFFEFIKTKYTFQIIKESKALFLNYNIYKTKFN